MIIRVFTTEGSGTEDYHKYSDSHGNNFFKDYINFIPGCIFVSKKPIFKNYIGRAQKIPIFTPWRFFRYKIKKKFNTRDHPRSLMTEGDQVLSTESSSSP